MNYLAMLKSSVVALTGVGFFFALIAEVWRLQPSRLEEPCTRS
jgi:hypothetical protein